ncbi:beta-lactamase family protein [Candidatus Bathyarchaeota archaeon]|nr:beta-lactamase family protein [Candidatus Bathyarchaeota archaeon]
MSRFLSVAALGLHLAAFAGGAEAKKYRCPPLGISLPAPKTPSSSEAVANTLANAQDLFDNLTGSFEGTAVSLTLKSIHEDAPLLDLHHTPAQADDRSVSEVDAQTLYRIASMSKMFSPLAVLQIAEINLDDPVTKYLPELLDLQGDQEDVNELTTIMWDEITVGSLTNHMAGFGSESKSSLESGLPWRGRGLICV